MSTFVPDKTKTREHITEALDLLKTGIAKLDTPEGFINHLIGAARGNLHRYSPNNQLLILVQCPEATIVGGYKFWVSKGRKPIAGRGLRILAPATFKKVVEVENEETGETEEETIFRLRFKTVVIWDITATDGPPLPVVATGSQAPSFFLQDDEADERVAALDDLLRERVAAILGVPVVVKDNGAAYGVFRPIQRVIEVSPRHDPLTTCASTAHEIAHAWVHDTKADSGNYAIEEWVAEGVSFAFLAFEGFRTDRFSFDYIQGWGGTTKGIVNVLGRIHKIVSVLIDWTDGPTSEA